MKPSVFISHSGKDLESEERARADPERLARLDFARKVRDGIADDRRLQHLDVWLDLTRLEPGMEWRAKLHNQLARCDGVIPLSEDSLGSDWVRKEATILTWRKYRSPALVLIPVLLGATSRGDLVRDGWALWTS